MSVKVPELGSLRILLVEDVPDDAARVVAQILAAGMEASFQRVDEEAQLQAALREFRPDVVLAELNMAGFSGFRALDIVRQAQPELPFLFLSSTTGEEAAVAALQRGASDYILKHQPARLPSAVARAVREARASGDRQRVEAELMRAQRLESLSLLAAGLSHDLRNILQPLLIMPDLLKARTEDPRLWHMADIIAECGRRGHEMAQLMLSFVRGTRSPSERVQVQQLFEAVQLLLRGTLPDNIALHMETADEALAMDGNYTELQQVLLNLTLNAIQAMPDGGRLTLQATPVDGAGNAQWLCISVIDEGTGMDAATQERLFAPFFTTKADGTGLGLISCKRIIESCGGRIQVSSVQGQGSRFDLHLPVSERAEGTEATEAMLHPEMLGRGQSILVVDGETTRLSLLGNALSSQGYQLELAADGAAALRWMQQAGMPQLVIVDGGSPLLSASDLLQELAAQGYSGPALLLEEEGVPVPVEIAPAGIVLHVLRKPLEMQQVFRSVSVALRG
ncbi:ATP-binding response regulator [Stenotrophomonas tumulicola]|uniref:histidine kinase n=1 Tax=Stenotrophomonas tumulicola TaxID=1685415 RepID=A0A7W3FL49_9GAMM|nr:ATP-binding protein [Stenotrophomonas tumulicola]MBA8681596.1 response regulator [Stenotrophomonas tumulicola]